MSAMAPTIVELGALPLAELSAEVRRSIRVEWEKDHQPPAPKPKAKRYSWKKAKKIAKQGLKHCAQCNQDKPVSEFWKNGYCRQCGRAKDREMHRHRLLTKPCPTCGVVKDRSAFPPGSGRHGCFECKANPKPKILKWKPSQVSKLRMRRTRVAATLAKIDAKLAELTTGEAAVA